MKNKSKRRHDNAPAVGVPRFVRLELPMTQKQIDNLWSRTEAMWDRSDKLFAKAMKLKPANASTVTDDAATTYRLKGRFGLCWYLLKAAMSALFSGAAHIRLRSKANTPDEIPQGRSERG